jgi:prolyl 4-hydroxylase
MLFQQGSPLGARLAAGQVNVREVCELVMMGMGWHGTKMQVDIETSGASLVSQRLRAVPNMRVTPSAHLAQFFLSDFVAPDACAALIDRIDQNIRPSTLADAGDDDTFRTSMTCDLDHADPLVATLDQTICDLIGIAADYGEPLQGQRYDVGQEFKYHTDYFEPSGYDYAQHCRIAGQRTWTAMLYLNDVTAGGGTRFKATGKIFQPETGKLLIWNNLTPQGLVNPHSLHHGMKVRAGRKYVITKWYRERPWPWPSNL